jgi:hypothetical protein
VVEHLRVFDHAGFFLLAMARDGRYWVACRAREYPSKGLTIYQKRPPQAVMFTVAAATLSRTIRKGSLMSLGLILLIVLILLLLGVLPSWNHSRSWGYGPSGGLGVLLVIVLVLVVMGRI